MSDSTHGLTYAEISTKLSIPRCRGIRDGQRCYADHDGHLGDDGLVHWRDRRVTRAGIKRFLMIASGSLVVGTLVVDGREIKAPGWWTRYYRLMWVKTQLAALHLQLSASAWAEDKAKLRAAIARSAVVPEYAGARREAMRWAQG